MNTPYDNTTPRPAAPAARTYRPRLSFFHANAKGTGSALTFELVPATAEAEGCVRAKITGQMTVGDRSGPTPVYPRFDWGNALSLKLGFTDLSKMLQVFRGECESLEDGKGLYHRSAKGLTRICLRHILEPFAGYSLEVYRSAQTVQDEGRAAFLFHPHEALGLAAALESSFGVLCFGLPTAAAETAPRAAARPAEEASHAA